ncbi:CAP domain-containing protein [Sphingomonas quercus]|uniref:SCP domain-containing protein n=1 Tax=Sphingomonas quercus TaxID=2842451 RepID=A0ABS6BFL2_9SPHN|nr:CAP domain-containing protein [Sphingomonas quercus]MBU3076984.1 hypothetical protein [Sphingomonas quercus]
MAGPTDQEQLLLEYLNETRLDPLGSAARYISSYAPLTSGDADIRAALNYFHVNGQALQAAYAALTPVAAVAWNDNLAAGARTHDQVMIDQQVQTHQASGEADFASRVYATGYTGWSSIGENVYAYADDMLYAHAGFMVDWGDGANGMQNPAGHRDNIMNARFNEVGIGVLIESNPATPVGPNVVTQDFGVRSGAGRYLLGVAYTDRDHDGFYSAGEGRGDLAVTISGRAGVSYASGGWQIDHVSGSGTAMLSGGGLAGTVSIGFQSGTLNMKLDVVNGDTLRVWTGAGPVSVAGAVPTVEIAGALGGMITLADAISRTVTGGSGNDTVVGGGGHDVLFGGAGNDQLSGGDGNDHLYGRAASTGADGDDVLAGGNGSDYLQGNAGNDQLSGGAGSDRIQGGADNDVLRGDDGNDVMNGNRGQDRLYGGEGNDLARGGQDNDELFGDAGQDTLMGDVGDDRLSGGGGIDVLFGGAGADLFLFTGTDAAFTMSGPTGGAADAIADWQDGVDHLSLGSHVLLHGGNQADLAAGYAYAQSLLDGQPGTGDLAIVGIGGETWLFWGNNGAGQIDSAIRIANTQPGMIEASDFV